MGAGEICHVHKYLLTSVLTDLRPDRHLYRAVFIAAVRECHHRLRRNYGLHLDYRLYWTPATRDLRLLIPVRNICRQRCYHQGLPDYLTQHWSSLGLCCTDLAIQLCFLHHEWPAKLVNSGRTLRYCYASQGRVRWRHDFVRLQHDDRASDANSNHEDWCKSSRPAPGMPKLTCYAPSSGNTILSSSSAT